MAKNKRKPNSKNAPQITRADLYEAIRTSDVEGMEFLDGGKMLDLSYHTIYNGTADGVILEADEEGKNEEEQE